MLAVTLIAMIVMAANCFEESSEGESSEVDTFDAREQLLQDFVEEAFAKRTHEAGEAGESHEAHHKGAGGHHKGHHGKGHHHHHHKGGHHKGAAKGGVGQ